jgi:hypothetical protein
MGMTHERIGSGYPRVQRLLTGETAENDTMRGQAHRNVRQDHPRQLAPNANGIAVLANPSDPDPEAETDLKRVETAARTVEQQLCIVNASSEHDFEPHKLPHKPAGLGYHQR